MSLRDQLTKAGVVSKKDAKKAANKARQKRRKENKALREDPTNIEVDEVTHEIQARQEERKQLDIELNKDREEKRLLREKVFQAREIAATHDQRDLYARTPYYFVGRGSTIHRILVSDKQRELLALGKLSIATSCYEKDYFHLLSYEDSVKVNQLDDATILCWHQAVDSGSV